MAGYMYLGNKKVCPAIVAKEPVISSLNVTPSTSEQTIEAPSGTDGYNPINVSAVTSSIDSNIIPENIKKDVTILNVVGTLEGGGESVRNGLEPDQNGKLSWVKSGNIVFSGFTDVAEKVFYERFGQSDITSIDLSNLKTISGNRACEYMFSYCSQLTSADLSGLETISGEYACNEMFSGCSELTSANLSNLKTIIGTNACEAMFYYCPELTSADLGNLETIRGSDCCGYMFSDTGITSADLSGLETISGNNTCMYMFYYCPELTSVDLSNLKTISGDYACDDMFAECPELTSVVFSSLETISGSGSCSDMFYYCNSLESLSFPSLKTISKNAFIGLVDSCNGVTIHFPSNMESTIQGLDGYPNFGGSNTTLLFDLPAVNL